MGRSDALRQAEEGLLLGQRILIGAQGARPGVGRTALAATLAHRLGARMPSAPLWIPGASSDMALLLARIRLGLGLPLRQMTDQPARAIAATLQEFQPLLILDDLDPAALAELPGDVPLVATLRGEPEPLVPGDRAFTLGSLEDDDARALIEATLAGADPHHLSAALELKDLMMGHPLGMCFALAVVRETGTTDPRGLLSHLRPKLKRLGEFPVERRGVAAIFGLLLNQLTQEDRALVANLGMLPQGGFDLQTAAAGLGLTQGMDLAREAIGQALRLSLLEDIGDGRWRLRNLVGDLARGMGEGEEAHRRLATHHLGILRRGDDVEVLQGFEGILASLSWARDRSHAPLVMGIGRALMATELDLGLEVGTELRMGWTLGAARTLGHRETQVEALLSLGRHMARGGGAQRSRAQQYLLSALQVRALDERGAREAEVLALLGELALREARPAQALPHLRAAADIPLTDGALRARIVLNLGLALAQIGDYAAACPVLEEARDALPPGTLRESAEAALADSRQHRALSSAFAQGPAMGEGPDGDGAADDGPRAGDPGGQDNDDAPPRRRARLGPGESFDPLNTEELHQLVGRHRALLKLAERADHQPAAARHREALAILAQSQGDMDGAMALYLEALENWSAAGDTQARAGALVSLGRTEAAAGHLDEALYHLLEALELRGTVHDDAARAGTLLELAEVLLERGRPEDAERHLDLCQSLFSEVRDLKGLAGALLARGRASALGGHPLAAEAWVRRALDLGRSLEAEDVEARAEEQLGRLALERGRFDEGLKHLKQSIHLYYGGADLGGLARSLLAMGELHRRKGEGAQAFSYLKRVRDLAQSLGLKRVEAASLRALGELASDLDRPGEARRALREALNLQRRIGDQSEEIRTLVALVDVEVGAGDHAAALPLGEEAVQLAQDAHLDGLLAEALQGLALALAPTDTERARALLREAMEIDRRRFDRRGVGVGLSLIAQLDLAEGHLEPARRGLEAAAKELEELDPSAAALLRRWVEEAEGASAPRPGSGTPG